MHKNVLHINKQSRDAVAFIILSIIIIFGIIVTQEQRHEPPVHGQEMSISNQTDNTDNDDIPAEVMREATSCAYNEWEYIRSAFPECNYCDYKLESVFHVLSCQHVDDETFEVFGITCSYRRDGHEDWETAENAANSFLVFRSSADSSMEWIGDISTYNEPGTSEFENDVHEVLMNDDEKNIFKLLSSDSLKQTLEGTLSEYLHHLIPGDYTYFGWKQLAQEITGDHGKIYGILLFHTNSGSPLIYSEQTNQYVSAIYSTYLLPIRVTYQKDKQNRYFVTSLWEPSEENYELDVRENFPKETADLILEKLDQCTIDILQESGVEEGDSVFEFFPGGPVWPTYTINDALDNATLCSLADYYQDGDIYCVPVRKELIQRFCDDPVGMLNALGTCNEDTQNSVCNLLVESEIYARLDSTTQTNLSDEGIAVYKTLESMIYQK